MGDTTQHNTASLQPTTATTSKTSSPLVMRRKNRKSRKMRNRNWSKNLKFQNRKSSPTSRSQSDSPEDSGRVDSKQWMSTYEKLVHWHNSNHLKNIAQNLRLENELLKQRLNEARRHLPLDPDSSSDDTDDAGTESGAGARYTGKVDAKYLEFMAITEKHKLEVRLKKEQQISEEKE